ncbi:MAG: long-chain fatty acid--CoA ligase [Candidatus Omnitrophota bacterium]
MIRKSSDLTLVDMFTRVSSSFPKKTAVVFGSKKITYASLRVAVDKLAAGLYNLGLGRNDHACLWLPNCPEFVYSYFAILKVGATVVPINSMFKREEAKFVVEDSQAKILICSIDKLDEAKVILSRVDSLKHLVCVPSCKEKGCLGFYKLIKQAGVFKHSFSISGDSIAEILYTSGTTGRPKGACLSHGNLLANIRDAALAINMRKNDCALCILPLFHSFASTVCMLLPIYAGAKIVIMRTIRPFKRVIRAVFKNKVTVFVAVPSLYTILAEHKLSWYKLLLARILNPVRLCISGAAALPKETLKRFESKFKRPLLEGYGLTEASPVVSLNPLKGKRKLGSVGLVFASLRIKIVDKQGRLLAADEVGELLVKGPSVMKGYYRLEEESEKTLRDGWLYTGDLAKIDTEGHIHIMGRIKDMINVRGLNVYPREIEDVLYKHPKVKEASVVGVLHRHRGEVPVVFVIPAGGIKERELISYLRANLASYKVPLKVIFKEVFPKNSTGKILKRELQEEIKDIFNQ